MSNHSQTNATHRICRPYGAWSSVDARATKMPLLTSRTTNIQARQTFTLQRAVPIACKPQSFCSSCLTRSSTTGNAAATSGESSMVINARLSMEMVIRSTAGRSPSKAADSSKSFSPMSCAVSVGGKSLA